MKQTPGTYNSKHEVLCAPTAFYVGGSRIANISWWFHKPLYRTSWD